MPIEDSGEGFYYLMITQDITEEVNKNIETNQKNRELEASNKELQAFNYVASHDLQDFPAVYPARRLRQNLDLKIHYP